jgi:hypothetical protein
VKETNVNKKSVLALTLFVSSLLPVLPALAAMEALNDEDMDSITAAGQPTVAIAENGEAVIQDNSSQLLNMPTDAQHGLRALALINAVGEAQLATNLNVVSVAGDIAGVDQRNFTVQSWGSTLPKISESVEGEPAVENETTQIGGCLADCEQTLIDKGDNSIGVTNIAAQGIVEIASATGDMIADGGDGSQIHDNSTAALNFDADSQTDLAALFIANIVGRTQASFNVNIASSTLNLFPSTDQPFSEPATSSSAVMKQTNSAVQFRGTPINAAASIFVEHSPH